jgi:hypothetical protein
MAYGGRTKERLRVERLDAVDCEYHVTASQIMCADWTWKRVRQFMYMMDAYRMADKSRYCIDGYLTWTRATI